MGYYIRVLGERSTAIPLHDLTSALNASAKGCELLLQDGPEEEWIELLLKHNTGPEIAVIERNPVLEGELGYDELHEFLDEIDQYGPKSAVRWLQGYLPRVQVIYAFRLLSGTDIGDGWAAVHAIQTRIWRSAGGILHADHEGFSNEDGFHILWQFYPNVTGKWSMAVLNGNGTWSSFEMELGDEKQRAAFLEGRVPEGAKLL